MKRIKEDTKQKYKKVNTAWGVFYYFEYWQLRRWCSMESTIEPSKVRTLVVPIGKWRRNTFLETVKELEAHNEIRLVDVTPVSDCTFNPQLFPHGRVIYLFMTREYDSNAMMFLHDFEPYRKLFVVIGLCNDESMDGEACINELKDLYGSAITYGLIFVKKTVPKVDLPSKNSIFSTLDEPLETILCDITRNFLEALDTYYSSYKHVTLRSPGAIGGPSVLKTTLTKNQFQSGTIVSPKKVLSQSTIKDDSSSSSLSLSEEIPKDKPKRYSSLNALSSVGTDKSMQRSKARQLKLLANLQLLAGQYQSSMINFAEAARTLHKVHDYIWLGNALEGIVTCMILLSYLQIPFQIPQVVQTMCAVSQNNLNPWSQVPTSSKRDSMQSIASPRSSMSTTSMTLLDSSAVDIPKLIKAIADKALYYYDHSLSYSVEFTPQVVYCKSILRTLTFMSLCYKAKGFNHQILKEMVFSNIQSSQLSTTSEPETIFTKAEIYHYSIKIFELQLKAMDLPSQIQVYLTLCTVYENLGMYRKKAFVLRILFISIISQISNDYVTENYQALIDDLLTTYKISNYEPEQNFQDASSYNWVTLQKNTLMLIIKIYQHFKNYIKVVEYSQILLKRLSHTLTKLEQTDLLNQNILSHQKDYPVEYMDPFLVRDVSFTRTHTEEMPMLKVITSSSAKRIVNNQDTHQIFNPFAAAHHKTKENETEDSNYFLVAETVQMNVTLQNPFKFDVKVNCIDFTSADKEYMRVVCPELTSFVIPVSSKKQFCIGVSFKKPTNEVYELKELAISVFDFPIKCWRICKDPNNNSDSKERFLPYSVPITVIDQQPNLTFLSTSLVNNRLMLLDGTKARFKLFLRNSSLSSPINYCSISWITNVEAELKDNYWSKLMPDDIHDIEYQMDWLKKHFITISSMPEIIGINESFHLDVDLNAEKTPFSLKWVRITIQYGYKKSSEDSSVYVKTLTIPIEITLQRVLEVSNVSFIPLAESFSEPSNIPWIAHLQKKDLEITVSDYVLMLIDMRNSWLHPVSFEFEFDEYKSGDNTLESNETKRFVLPIRKIGKKVEDKQTSKIPLKQKPIPRIDESKQFISSGLNFSQEQEMREKFWCREYILEHLKCKWHEQRLNGDSGIVDFRQFLEKFEKQFIKLLYPPSGMFEIRVTTKQAKVETGTHIVLEITVNNTLRNPDIIPIRYYILDYFTGKAVPNDAHKPILFHGQNSIMVRPQVTTQLNLLPIKRGKYQIEFEVPGNVITREPVIITVV